MAFPTTGSAGLKPCSYEWEDELRSGSKPAPRKKAAGFNPQNTQANHRYPFSLNQPMALSMLWRTGVWDMPSSFTALDESQNE